MQDYPDSEKDTGHLPQNLQPKQAVSDGGEREHIIENSIDPENEIRGAKLVILHLGLCLCTLLTGLDFNLIATAVPVITSDISSIRDVGWYGASYFISLCTTQPLAAKTFTLFPKTVVYLAHLAIFEIGSLVCALAPTSQALIVGRAIAGFGASGIFAGGLIVLTTVIPLHRRAVWIGTLNSTFAVASVVGPVIGGALTEHVSWRWCFYINLPVGGLAAAFVLLCCRIKRASTEDLPLMQKIKCLDALGFLLFTGSVAMLLLALQWGGIAYGWKSSVIIGLLVGSGVVMSLFVAWQLFVPDIALIPPRLFANRNVVLIFSSALFSNGPFQLIIYWLPIWFQAVLGVTPTASGIRYLPTVIADFLTSIIGTGIVTKLGTWNPFLIFGAAMVSLGAGLLSTIHPGTPEGHWIGFQIISGVGYSLIVTMAHMGVQASLPSDLVPFGATNLLFVISASCAIFLAVGQAVFQARLVSNLVQVVPAEAAKSILTLGANSIRSNPEVQDLSLVLQAYSSAITQILLVPAAAAAISFVLVSSTKWISTKKAEPKGI